MAFFGKKEANGIRSLLRDLVRLMEQRVPYADALFIQVSRRSISRDKSGLDVEDAADKGVKLRVYDGWQFHEHGTSDLDPDSLRRQAELLASKVQLKPGVPLGKNAKVKKVLQKDFSSRPAIDPAKVSVQKKIEACERMHARISAADSRIVNTRVAYAERIEDKVFVSREKSLYQRITGCRFAMMPFVQTPQGETRYHFESHFRPGFEAAQVPEKKVKDAIDMAIRIIDAKKIKPGRYPCVLAPAVTGLLAHESFGHGMEGDTMHKDRAKASQYLKKPIAERHISIVDNPALPGRNGSFFFDDEGQLTGMTYLVKDGIVTAPITDMHSAMRLKMPRTGNARAESFDHKVYARMSNTYFLPGKAAVENMLRGIEDGYFLHHGGGGMEDPKGWGVQITGVIAEAIRDGKLTGELFYEVGISGFLPDILRNITDVGGKLEVEGAGACGKGHKEWVRVSEGGPHLKVLGLDLS
jgi:TldD protein